MEVDTDDVVRVVLQFLRESKLHASCNALEEETGVRLSTVNRQDVVDELRDVIKQGKWSRALAILGEQRVVLADDVAWRLYERVIGYLVVNKQEAAARELLLQCQELAALKSRDGERFDALQDVVYHDYSAARQKVIMEYTDEMGEKVRRDKLARDICSRLQTTAPSRLLELLGDAIAWRVYRGEPTTLLGPAGRERTDAEQSALTKASNNSNSSTAGVKRKRDKQHDGVAKTNPQGKSLDLVSTIKMNGSVATIAAFSPNGQSLATGSQEGFIEIWNWATGKLRKDLAFQAVDEVMMHKEAVLALAFGTDSKKLASGSLDGTLKIWSARSGKCKLRVKKAHLGKAVNSVSLNRAGDRLLSGGGDYCARMFGTENGTMLLEFKGHEGQVNQVLFFADEQYVATASSDHHVRVWNAQSAAPIQDCQLGMPVHSLVYSKIVPKIGNVLLTMVEGKGVFINTDSIHDVHYFSNPTWKDTRFVVAPRKASRLLVAGHDPRGTLGLQTPSMNCTGEEDLFSWQSVHHVESEVLALVNHPTQPLVAFCGADGRVLIFKYDA